MAGLFTMAIVNIRKSHIHKRLMMLLMIGMLTPAIARVFLTLFAPPGAGRRTAARRLYQYRRRWSPISFLSQRWFATGVRAAGLILSTCTVVWFGAQQVLTVPFAATATWMSIAKGFESLAG